MSNRIPSLEDQRDWFERMAAEPDQLPQDRLMWEKLAEEITQRLGDRKPIPKEEGLW